MTSKELINKSIEEIRIRITPYSYEGTISLEQIEVEIKLEPKSEFSPKLQKVYPRKMWKKIFNKKDIFSQIDGQKIKGI